MPILRSLLVVNRSVDRKFVCILQNQWECLCEFNLQRDYWLCIVRRGVKVKSICFGTLIMFIGKRIIDYRRVGVHSKTTYETLYGYSSMGVFHIFLNCTNCAATLLKVTLLHGCFPRFLNCKNGSHFLIIQMVSNRAKHHIFV